MTRTFLLPLIVVAGMLGDPIRARAVETHTLTLEFTGAGLGGFGYVASTPEAIDCGSSCEKSFQFGTVLTLAATPFAGSKFLGWGGECSGSQECQVAMDSDRLIYVAFVPDSPTLSVARAGSGTGLVYAPGTSLDCGLDCTASFTSGSDVTLVAVPDADTIFKGWNGDIPASCVHKDTCSVHLTQDRNITAIFAKLCPKGELYCGPPKPQIPQFPRPSDATFLSVAQTVEPDAQVLDARKATLPETGRALWCAKIGLTNSPGGTAVCLNPDLSRADLVSAVSAERL